MSSLNAAVGTGGSGWRHLHWITPLARTWLGVTAVLVIGAQRAAADSGSIADMVKEIQRSAHATQIVAAILGGFVLIVAAYCLIWWYLARFRVTDDALEVVTGVLFRRRRRVRLDRLQAVDLRQPFLGRLVGFAAVRLESAGGHNSNIDLAYLTENQATALRADLLARSAGLHVSVRPNQSPFPADAETSSGQGSGFGQASSSIGLENTPEAPETELVAVPLKRLISSVLRMTGLWWLLLWAVVFVVVAMVTSEPEYLAGSLATLIAPIGLVWARIQIGLNFRLAAAPDGLRLRYGMLQHTSQTVPPGRVQALELIQLVFWRRPDWWQIKLNVAGYGDGNSFGGTTLLPVGTVSEVDKALWAVRSDLVDSTGRAAIGEAMAGTGPAQGWTVVPRRARWLDPLAWRHLGYAVTPVALLIRSGRWRRRVAIVPHERVQAMGLSQGPVQRRLGLASVHLHSTAGPVEPRIKHLRVADAMAFLPAQAARATAARATAAPEQWMR